MEGFPRLNPAERLEWAWTWQLRLEGHSVAQHKLFGDRGDQNGVCRRINPDGWGVSVSVNGTVGAPNAALAGIVANAVLSLIEVHEFRELWRMRRSEFWIGTVSFLSVLALGPLRAVGIAFLISTIDGICRAPARTPRRSWKRPTAVTSSPRGRLGLRFFRPDGVPLGAPSTSPTRPYS